MSEAPTLTPPARRKSRRLLWVVLALLIVLVGGGAIFYFRYLGDPELQQAVAEADRLDPGWTLEQLDAKRAVVPEKENSAFGVLAAGKLLPNGWLAPATPDQPDLERELAELSATASLSDDQRARLRAALDKVDAAVTAARLLADRPGGRYTIVWAVDGVGTPMPHLLTTRNVARLLELDALRLTEDGRLKEALASCRAALNAGRSLGDEPAAISQLVRVACTGFALRGLERVLARGEVSQAALEAWQRLLEEEDRAPLQLLAARSERALVHRHLTVVRSGRFDRANYGLRTSMLGATADNLVDRGRAGSAHAEMLRFQTEMVEIAKLPAEQQHDRLDQMKPPDVKLPVLLADILRNEEDGRKALRAFHAYSARLRCAAVALATERDRLDHGRWPERADDLAPRYLPAVPTDPFDGKPVRVLRTEDGVVCYTLGPDRKEDGGRLGVGDARGTDLGFRLYDVTLRRRQAQK